MANLTRRSLVVAGAATVAMPWIARAAAPDGGQMGDADFFDKARRGNAAMPNRDIRGQPRPSAGHIG